MASKIEWTGSTWNPIVGCSVVSPGCTNCYAMRLAGRLERMGQERYAGLTEPTKAGPVWTGETRLVESALPLPLRTRTPTTWFVNSMSDLFHESVPDAWIDDIFAVMALCPQHTFQVLTKRSARMRAYMTSALGRIADAAIALRRSPFAVARGLGPSAVVPLPHVTPGKAWWPLPNVWLGVSAEDQRRADERVPALLATPAAIRFVSAEPLLGPIRFDRISLGTSEAEFAGMPHITKAEFTVDALGGAASIKWPPIDWIIVGGESGPGARPMHPDWARMIRDQCSAAGVAFFFKQWGAWSPRLDRDLDDPDWRADYRSRFGDGGASQWLNLAGGRGFHGERFHVMGRVGKGAAGRMLDGAEHNGMPR